MNEWDDGRLGVLRRAVDVLASQADPGNTIAAWTHVVCQGFAERACVHQVDGSRREGVRRTAEAVRAGADAPLSADSPALLTAVHDALVTRRRRRVATEGAAVLVVPVVVQGEVLGTVAFVSAAPDRWARRDERETAEVLAALLAQPLSELAVPDDPGGVDGVVDLPPPAPVTPGLDVTVLADADGRPSPVWVDAIPLSAFRTALVAGEVGVAGPRGADLARRLRYSVRALATVDLPPDVLLRHLSDLVRRFDPGIVVTCVYAVHDAAAQELRLANAGHVPPLLVSVERPGEYQPLATAIGAPLGIGSHGVRTVTLGTEIGTMLVLPAGTVAEGDRLSQLGERVARIVGVDDLEAAARGLLHPDALTDGTAAVDGEQGAGADGGHGHEPADGTPGALVVARERDAGLRHQVHALPDDAEAAPAARMAVRAVQKGWGLEAHAEAIDLLVTELVTNGVRHARPPFAMRLIRSATSFVCEVSDGSMRAPVPRVAGWEEEEGRGLALTSQLADRWGYRQVAEGKVVWFEIDVAG